MAWQAPDEMGDRFRWAVATITPKSGDYELRYITGADEFGNLNQGKSTDDLNAFGFHGYPGFPVRKESYSSGVREALLRRLPDRSRIDFGEFLERHCLDQDGDIDDLLVLAASQGILPSDGFSFVDSLYVDNSAADYRIEVVGFRYYAAKLPPLVVGTPLTVRHEVGNPYDPNAVSVELNGAKIGNVNRLQTTAFRFWIATKRADVRLQALNGSSAKPRAFMHVHVSPARSLLEL